MEDVFLGATFIPRSRPARILSLHDVSKRTRRCRVFSYAIFCFLEDERSPVCTTPSRSYGTCEASTQRKN